MFQEAKVGKFVSAEELWQVAPEYAKVAP